MGARLAKSRTKHLQKSCLISKIEMLPFYQTVYDTIAQQIRDEVTFTDVKDNPAFTSVDYARTVMVAASQWMNLHYRYSPRGIAFGMVWFQNSTGDNHAYNMYMRPDKTIAIKNPESWQSVDHLAEGETCTYWVI
jgi:hypothetical protein